MTKDSEVFVDEYGPAFRARGMLHTLAVVANDNNTGWVILARDAMGSTAVNLPQSEAVELANMLLGGPGEPKWACAEHKKLTVCLECLK